MVFEISPWFFAEVLSAIALVIVGYFMYLKHIAWTYWEKRGVVYDKPKFPFGNFGSVFLGKESLGVFDARIYAQYKHNRYFGIYGFGKPALMICDPDLIRNILVKNFSNFHDRGLHHNVKIDPLSGHLFFLTGSKWKNLRAKLTPTFTSGKMKQMFSTVHDCAFKMADYLEKYADRREIVELKDLTARVTTDVIVSVAFGIESNSIENPDSDFRYWGRKAFEPNLKSSMFMFVPKLMDFFKIPGTNKSVSNFFIKAFKDTVDYRNENNITRPDFMNLLIQLMNRGYVDNDDGKVPNISETTGGSITLLEGVAQAFVFFLAGFETTSTTISYCLYELSRECNKEIQEKTRADIDAALRKSDGQATYDSIQEMTYLDQVVDETLRKYPPLPFLNRSATNDVELPETDLKILKGMNIIIPILGIHRDENIYPDPLKFDPERFNQENTAARHPYVFLPFGEGPRICIGSRFGLLSTKLILISLLSKYKFSMGPDTPDPLTFTPGSIVLMAKSGIELKIEHR